MANRGISKLFTRPTLAVVLRYGLAVLLVGIALAITLITRLHNSPPRFVSHFVLLAIAITFWFSGTGPGVLAFLLSCLGVRLFAKNHILLPGFPLWPFLSFFAIFSLLMGWFAASRRRAQRLLSEARDGLEIRVKERTREIEETQQALQRSESYLAEAQRLTHTGSWVWNVADRCAVHLSEELYRLYGWDPSDRPPTWEKWIERIHPEDRLKWKGAIDRAILEKTDYEDEFRIVLRGGIVRWINTVGHPVLTAAGALVQFIGSSTDITERKRAEEERERLHQLEADLAHINRINMMGELAASLAHEIKQPIAATITSASACLRWLAHDPPDLGRARAAAIRIEQDGNRAADVISHLQSFYKKGTPPEREMVDVNEIAREMVALLRSEAVRYSISIYSEVGADMPKILADRVQLQQVFMNLMLNAIEAMKDKGGELTITSRLNQEGQLMISVSDTGAGLPPEGTDRLFDAFYTTKPQGTGMGLAITRSIVESHGGRVWVTANEGAGATFHFTLRSEAEAHV